MTHEELMYMRALRFMRMGCFDSLKGCCTQYRVLEYWRDTLGETMFWEFFEELCGYCAALPPQPVTPGAPPGGGITGQPVGFPPPPVLPPPGNGPIPQDPTIVPRSQFICPMPTTTAGATPVASSQTPMSAPLTRTGR